VVDDDDVTFDGAPVHLGDEAPLELRALGAGALVAARIKLLPEG